MKFRASAVFLAPMPFVLGIYVALGSPLAQAVLYEGITAASIAGVLVGVRVHRPRDPRPWYLFAAGLGAFLLGDVAWDVMDLGFGIDPFPSVADGFYLLGYPLIAAGLMVLARGRTGERPAARSALIDVGIVTVAAGVVAWVFLLEPYARNESLTTAEILLSGAYPLMDVLLLAVLARLMLSPGASTPAFWLLAASIAVNIGADVAFGVLELGPAAYVSGSYPDVGWLLGYLLFGAAALDPSMRALGEVVRGASGRLTRAGFATLAAASVAVPAVLVVHGPRESTVSLAVIVAGAALLPLLALARVAGAFRDLERLGGERELLLVSERLARAEAETAQRLLAEQNDRLRELDRMKDEFVALVSHELRTPLTSITGYLELLAEGAEGLDDQQRRFVDVVIRNSRRLDRLVTDLLTVAQIDDGKLRLEFGEVDLAAIASDSVESMRPTAEAKSVDLLFDGQSLPRIRGDSARLAQLIDNLVSNAVKFTPAGGRVAVSTGRAGDQLIVAVSDTGIGIPKAEQRRLFERFFRASTALEAAIRGTGLGLTISRAIAEAHGGRIEVESTEGEGSVFRIRLPLTPALAPPSRAKDEGVVV